MGDHELVFYQVANLKLLALEFSCKTKVCVQQEAVEPTCKDSRGANGEVTLAVSRPLPTPKPWFCSETVNVPRPSWECEPL